MKSKTITKFSLVRQALPYSQVILIIIALILMFLELKLYEVGLFMIIGIFAVIGNSIMFVIRIIDIVIRFISLNKQEKVLGFSFNEEMQKNNVTSTKFESPEWYIDIRNFVHPLKRVVFIALKKDYIKLLNKKESLRSPSPSYLQPPFFPPYRGIAEFMIVVMIDDTKQKIIAYELSNIIDVFEVWYRRIDPKAQLPSKRKRKKREVRKGRGKKT